ncbi:hypothetical protein CgunFtcFv8_018205 [Champsocephalus gunnari]|uniref:Uncharacterized protein n=1 Tax=Champsocephalus gunnari TaxID=52237 RepID=A0AAN8HRI5_CHAGU|nr:hypothetical protein CgunFtcFv8_018205 [Champsocephalus gunnari]
MVLDRRDAAPGTLQHQGASWRALADAILEHKPADIPMRAPQLRFGTGKPKFPTLSPTSSLADPPTQTAGSACTSIQRFSHWMQRIGLPVKHSRWVR